MSEHKQHQQESQSKGLGECTHVSTQRTSLPIAEVLWVGVGVAEIVVDEHGRLAGQFEALAALVASDQIVQPHHVRTGFRKLAAVFLADAARQFFFLAANFPAHGSLELAAAARANQLHFPGLFFFGIELALVHNQVAGGARACPVLKKLWAKWRPAGSPVSATPALGVGGPFYRPGPPSWRPAPGPRAGRGEL